MAFERPELKSKLCRGNFRCTTCGTEGRDLHQDKETNGLKAYCWQHRPESQNDCVLYTGTALDVTKGLVTKVVIHKLNLTAPGDSSRRGRIVTLVPKDIPNKEMARNELVEIIQYCYMLIGTHYTIHNLGETGEQADCWVNDAFREPYGVSVDHKYWGEKQIEGFIRMLCLLAEIHGWEVEDERRSLLDRLAEAAVESPL